MPKRVPLRMCLGCRQMKPKTELTRAVKSPEGAISLDLTGKKPGRGAYICSDTNCLKRAIKSNALARAFKTQIPEDITVELHRTLAHLQLENPNES
jgi:hypothetical protein